MNKNETSKPIELKVIWLSSQGRVVGNFYAGPDKNTLVETIRKVEFPSGKILKENEGILILDPGQKLPPRTIYVKPEKKTTRKKKATT